VLPYPDESFRVIIREGAKQNGIYRAEDRRVSADAQREGDNSDYSEARLSEQYTNTVAEVLK
jgi:hypothetical protein